MGDSPAMAEFTAESALAGPSPWGDLPVTNSHNGTVLLLVAAEDHLKALCRMLERPAPTAFGPVVLARAALEAAGRAAWLAEPGIGAKRRVLDRGLEHPGPLPSSAPGRLGIRPH